MSSDPKTGEVGVELVTALLRTGDEDDKLDRDMVGVSVDVDADGQTDDTIETTAGHEFWVNLTEPSNDGAKWAPARDLASGAWLRTSSGTWVQTTAIATETRLVNTYNLTVANTHTYYIQTAATNVLVHNCEDLVKDEAEFPDQAHTIKEHVNVTEAQAVALAQRKPRGLNSVYNNLDTAQSTVSAGIAANASRISNWLRKSSEQKLTITGSISGAGSLGWLAHANGNIALTGNRYSITLMRKKGHSYGYFVYTSNPI